MGRSARDESRHRPQSSRPRASMASARWRDSVLHAWGDDVMSLPIPPDETLKRVTTALKAAHGNVSLAARMVNVPRATLRDQLPHARARNILRDEEIPDKVEYPHRASVAVKNGHVIVGSDFHIWPGSNG